MTRHRNVSSSGSRNEDDSIEAQIGKKLAIQEFLVDFLGGLVPGVFFIVASFFALAPAMHSLSTALSSNHKNTTFFDHVAKAFDYAKDTPSAIWIIGFIGATLLAYIVGHLFYRHDLKSADRSSFRRLAKVRENDTESKRKANLGCATVRECEFPYPHYDKYLFNQWWTVTMSVD